MVASRRWKVRGFLFDDGGAGGREEPRLFAWFAGTGFWGTSESFNLFNSRHLNCWNLQCLVGGRLD